jgi:hypothetical protein
MRKECARPAPTPMSTGPAPHVTASHAAPALRGSTNRGVSSVSSHSRRRDLLYTVLGMGSVMGLYLAAAVLAVATDHSRIASLLVILAAVAAIPYLLVRAGDPR